MLDQMRSAAKSWVAKLFLGLLGVSFLVWGVPNSFLPQIGTGALFSSGDSSVRAQDYSFALRDRLMRLGVGRIPSAAELRDSGLAGDILARLHFDLLIDEQARRMRLGADEDAALQLLRQDSFFHTINGSFDRNSFLNYLNQAGFNQAEVIEKLQAQAKRAQLLDTLTTGLSAPDVFYQATLLYERETRSIDYVRITPDQLEEVEAPSDELLKSWFEERRDDFRAPEYRSFTYMQLNAQMLADAQTITDEQLQTYYEANKNRFAAPERREFEQLRFDNREMADAAYAKLQAGTSFEALIIEQGQDIDQIKRGPFARVELPSLMATDIFALPQGEVSEVINDLAGPVIVRITQIEAAQTPPLAEIADQLRRELALTQARAALRSTMNDIEEARFEGATLSELAAQYGLKLESRTINSDGVIQDNPGEQVEALPLHDALVAQVFASQIGVDRDPLQAQDDYVWYQLDTITPARNLEFDEAVDDGIRPSWINEQTNHLLVQKAQILKAELESGKDLTQIAQENGLVIERAAGLQRVATALPAQSLGEDVIAAVFALPANDKQKAVDLIFPQQERDIALLFQITDAAEPLSTDPQSLPKQQRDMISAQFAQDLTDQFVAQALDEHAIEINQTLLNELLSDNNSLSLR